MDNFRIDITCEGETALESALKIVFEQHRSVCGYAVRPATEEFIHEKYAHLNKPAKPLRLVFFWYASSVADYVQLPFKLDVYGARDFAMRWLAEQDYGHEPDHDGHNRKGWRVYNEAWGRVDEDSGSCVAISPNWAWYGK